MRPWQQHLDVSDLWVEYEDGSEETFVKVRDEFVRRLEAIKNRFRGLDNHDRNELDDVIDSLRYSENADEFDGNLDDLYDWADTDKRLWLETM